MMRYEKSDGSIVAMMSVHSLEGKNADYAKESCFGEISQ